MTSKSNKVVAVTGANGLLGWHARAHLHAANCAARFKGMAEPYEIRTLDRGVFSDSAALAHALLGVDAVLHFAGVNRGSDEEVAQGNPAIANALVEACKSAGVTPHIVYANSIHAGGDTLYGKSKTQAGDILAALGGGFTDLRIPHVFGEYARPFYNNVTATFIHEITHGRKPEINPDGRACLIHAGGVIEAAITAMKSANTGVLRLDGHDISITDLFECLQGFHDLYSSGTFPALQDSFETALFNSYRCALYPEHFPRALPVNEDDRGTLFETVKGGGGGQAFVSWTKPGITRGDHFHINKVERFLVLAGKARIQIRRVLHNDVWDFDVCGDQPAVVDMPSLHTHNIQNTGDTPLLTLFWTNEIFNPEQPDTYADPVVRNGSGE